jgi:oligosaccharide repeat unit polymerase
MAMPLLSKWIFRDYFSPFSIYGTSWLSLFGFYSLGWIEYISIKTSTWLILGGTLVLFWAGTWVAASIPLAKRANLESKLINWKTRLHQPRVELILLITFCLGLLGLLFYLRTVAALFGLDTLIHNMSLVRSGQSSSEFMSSFGSAEYSLLHLNMLCAVWSVLHLLVYGLRPGKWWVYAIGVISVGTNLLLGTRTQIFAIVIWSLFLWMYLRARSRVDLKLVISLILLTTVLGGLFLGIVVFTNKSIQNYDAANVQIRLPRAWWILADPYVYLTGGIPAFQEFISAQQEEFGGLFTVLPITKLLNKVYPAIPVPAEVRPGQNIPFWFNAMTYLDVYYQDWGLAGLIVAPFLIGLLSTTLYLQMRQKPTLWMIFVNSLIAYCLVFSVFNNRFITTYVWEFVLLGFFLTKSVICSPTLSDDNLDRKWATKAIPIVDETRL